MSDTKRRQEERAAAIGGPEDQERAALARCREGEHDWSELENVGKWIAPGIVDGLRVGRRVLRRVCYWCFKPDHMRWTADPHGGHCDPVDPVDPGPLDVSGQPQPLPQLYPYPCPNCDTYADCECNRCECGVILLDGRPWCDNCVAARRLECDREATLRHHGLSYE